MSELGRIGLLFPGQGSQYAGMGKDLAEQFPAAAEVFREADEVLGFPLSRLCWDGPADELTLTSNAQPAILVHSIAVWRLLQDYLPQPVMAAGHSLGEFSAYIAAGAISFADAVRTVRRRGELMLQSGEQRPGTMAAVLGLVDEAIGQVCREASGGDGVAVPANYNAPGQVVISGDRDAVGRAGEMAQAAGAKRVLPLNVSGAFHSPLMAVAESGLHEQLERVQLRPPVFPVVSNVTAQPVSDASEARELLVRQLTAPVRWVASVQRMHAEGVSHFFELGPGNVLTGLLRRIERGANAAALGKAAEIDAFIAEGAGSWS